MGLVETIPATASGSTGKYLENDPIMSPGSLFLWDPSHSLGAFSGVPTNGQAMPNIAWERAQSILGSGDETSLSATAIVVNYDAAQMFTERSSIGGLVGGYIDDITATRTFGVSAPSAVATHVKNTLPANQFYFSCWGSLLQAGGGNPSASPFHMATDNNNYVFHGAYGFNGYVPSDSNVNQLGVYRSRVISTLGGSYTEGEPFMFAIGVADLVGNPPADIRFISGVDAAWGSAARTRPLGSILKRVYVEDLTASGRSYADVEAIDRALYAAAHAEGGAWYGDTWTAVDSMFA